jgi:hypothetical protein
MRVKLLTAKSAKKIRKERKEKQRPFWNTAGQICRDVLWFFAVKSLVRKGKTAVSFQRLSAFLR